MNRRNRIAFGPGAASLILIVVVLSMSVLGILSLMSARGDLSFSVRSTQVIQSVYDLQNRAERTYGELDEILKRCAEKATSEDEYREAIEKTLEYKFSLENDQILWEETDGVRTLSCAVNLGALSELPRLSWASHSLTSEIGGDMFD